MNIRRVLPQELDEIAHIFQGYRYNKEIEWASPALWPPKTSFSGRSNSMMPVIPWARQAPCYARITKPSSTAEMSVSCGSNHSAGARFETQADVLILENHRVERATPEGMTRQTELL